MQPEPASSSLVARPTEPHRAAEPAPLFPAFLRLAGRKVVLVGGGTVAASKYAGLVAAGAQVTVVAPHIGPSLRTGGTTCIERAFEPEDLEGAWYVVAAAPAPVNRQVLAAAEARHLFVNAVDDPEAATAFAPAVIRRGAATVAVSTGGASPALAGLLREALEAILPADVARWTELGRTARQTWKADGIPLAARRPLLLEALNRLYAEGNPAAKGQPR